MPKKQPSKEANQYDKIFKENLEDSVLPILQHHWGIEVKSSKKIRNKLQSTTEREADFLIEVRHKG